MTQVSPGLFIAVYTDEDITTALALALRQRGYVAQSVAEAGNLGLPDEAQLAYATDHGMAILTYNTQDFISLAQAWYFAGRTHAGIIVSEQFSRGEFGILLRRMLRLLDSLTADEIHNQVIFLQRYDG
jgi:predicted nuclease of predicted toxin-antitoxin system